MFGFIIYLMTRAKALLSLFFLERGPHFNSGLPGAIFTYQKYFFVGNTFQIQPLHKVLAIRADVAVCFMPGA
jgi:hypothetical protein